MNERVQTALKDLQRELSRGDADKSDWLLNAIDELIQARIEERLGNKPTSDSGSEQP